MKMCELKFRGALTRSLWALSVILLSMMLCQVMNAQDVRIVQARSIQADASADFVPDQLIVKFKTTVAEQVKQAMLQEKRLTGVPQIDALNEKHHVQRFERVFKFVDLPQADKKLVAEFGLDRTYLLSVPLGTDIQAAVKDFSSLADVVYAEPNFIDHADLVPDDPTYLQQWGLNNTGQAVSYTGPLVGTPGADINAEAAWDLHTGDGSIILAILDSGVDYNHPEFSGRIVSGIDTGDGDNDPMDSNGHGTCCAGIAAAAGNNGIGVAGVNWNCMIMPVKIGAGAAGSFTHAAGAAGMEWAADHGADVLSCSYSGSDSETKQDGVDYAYAAGCVICASLGNDNALTSRYPASYWNVLAIGALSPCDERKSTTSCDGETFWGSNYGPTLDVMAPGARIHTTDILGAGGKDPGDYNPVFNGTSAACPFAAGVASLVRSYIPVLNNDQVYESLRGSAVDLGVEGKDDEFGYGRVNAFGALNYAAALVNNPPVAICQDVIAEANENCEAYVTAEEIDDGSYDPDGDPLTFSLEPEGPYPLGETSVTLSVSDAYVTETCTAIITVVDVTPPLITCPADITQGNDPGECGALVSFMITATDNCDNDVDIVCNPASGSFFPVGSTSVTATATDDAGNASQCTFNVTVNDVEPPVINTITSPIVLWPPNHKYAAFDLYDFILSVSDNCTSLDIDDVVIVSACSDEPENAHGNGDGNTIDDIVIDMGCQTIKLRKERAGTGNGRVYTIFFELVDEYGNTGTASAEVHVPHDNGVASIKDAMEYEEGCNTECKSLLAGAEDAQGAVLTAYPNPFNGTTTISYSVAVTSSVSIQVYNAMGALVKTLYEHVAEEGQEYTVTFRSDGLPEGVYYYNLRTGNGISITHKLILTK